MVRLRGRPILKHLEMGGAGGGGVSVLQSGRVGGGWGTRAYGHVSRKGHRG